MVLEHHAGRRSRSGGLLAVGAVLGWAGFVLAGPQQEKKVVVHCDDSTDGKKVVIINSDDNGSVQCNNMMLMTGDGPLSFGDGDGVFVMQTDEADASGGNSRAMIALQRTSAKNLAEFLRDHPTADGNGDGTLSQSEYNAYITALTLSDPARVLAQFPDADRNGDGKLDAEEAARLIVSPPKFVPLHGAMAKTICTAGNDATKSDVGNVEVNVTGSAGNDGQHVMVIRKTDANGTTTEQTVTSNGDGGVPILSKLPILKTMFTGDTPVSAGGWVLKNLTGTPAAGDVSKLVPVVENADLAVFLASNPKADRNGDGVLTSAEREAYLTETMSVMRQKFLAKNPESDTNADGVLTAEEMKSFLMSGAGKSNAGAEAIKKTVIVKDGKVFVDGQEVNPADGNVKIIRVDGAKIGGDQ